MTAKILCLLCICTFCGTLRAQDKSWNDKEAAISLTYDDALKEQLQNVIPLLDSLDIKATFYLTGSFPGFKSYINEWKKVATSEHELGNHTLFHPCDATLPGREWVEEEKDLSSYSVQRMAAEIEMTNILLQSLDEKSARTFAYPCGDMKAGDSSYVASIKSEFTAARGVRNGMEKIKEIDLFNVKAYMIHDQSGDELIEMVKQAREQNALLVFLFHGVGGGHDINVSIEAHQKLLQYLKQNEQDIWTAPFLEIAEYVKAHQ